MDLHPVFKEGAFYPGFIANKTGDRVFHEKLEPFFLHLFLEIGSGVLAELEFHQCVNKVRNHDALAHFFQSEGKFKAEQAAPDNKDFRPGLKVFLGFPYIIHCADGHYSRKINTFNFWNKWI